MLIKDGVETFAENCTSNLSKVPDIIDEWKELPEYKNKENSGYRKVVNMFYNLAQHMSYKILTENTFMNQVVDPNINAFLDNGNPQIVYRGSEDAELDESKEGKLKQVIFNCQDIIHIKGRIPDKSAYI
jgi:hypothetical protein